MLKRIMLTKKGYRSLLPSKKISYNLIHDFHRMYDNLPIDYQKELIKNTYDDITDDDFIDPVNLSKSLKNVTTKVDLLTFLRRSNTYLLYDKHKSSQIFYDNESLTVHLFSYTTSVPANINRRGTYGYYENILESYLLERNIKSIEKANKQKKYYFISHSFDNETDFNLFKKYYQRGISPVIIHLLITANKYDYDASKMYDHFTVFNGIKYRDIYAPQEDLKNSLRFMLEPLEKAYHKPDDVRGKIQYAYKKNLSIKDAAEVHKDYLWSVKLDISKFFDTCNWDLTKKYIRYLYNNVENDLFYEIDTLMEKILINPDTSGLYQGNPVSGVLSNTILRPAANYLKNICKDRGWVISIYADDITISSNTKLSLKNVIETVEYVFTEMDLPFKLNSDKSKLVKRNGRKIVGVRINHENELTIPRSKYRLLRSVLDRLDKGKDIDMKLSKLEGLLNFGIFIDDTGKVRRLVIKYSHILDKYKLTVPLKEPQINMEDLI